MLMFLAYNMDRDAAGVRDIVTAATYLSREKGVVDIFISGDHGLSAAFASVVPRHASLHLENMSELRSDDDYFKTLPCSWH